MNNKFIPENWAIPLQKDCASLVRKNLGIKINEKDVDVLSSNFDKSFKLIVKAMKVDKVK